MIRCSSKVKIYDWRAIFQTLLTCPRPMWGINCDLHRCNKRVWTKRSLKEVPSTAMNFGSQRIPASLRKQAELSGLLDIQTHHMSTTFIHSNTRYRPSCWINSRDMPRYIPTEILASRIRMGSRLADRRRFPDPPMVRLGSVLFSHLGSEAWKFFEFYHLLNQWASELRAWIHAAFLITTFCGIGVWNLLSTPHSFTHYYEG